MQETNNFTNYFLIAMPGMDDPKFDRAVAYICEHNENGALGLIINRPTNINLSEVLEQMEINSENQSINDIPILFGGPVHQERGFVIHRPFGEWRSSFITDNGICVTTSKDILEAMANLKGPDNVVVTLGYAGWGAGQLEDELKRNIWLVCPATPDVIFNTPLEKRWEAAAGLLGVTIQSLSGQTGHA